MVWSGKASWTGGNFFFTLNWHEVAWRHGVAWSGMKWHGVAWSGMEWHGVEWRAVAWSSKTSWTGGNFFSKC